MSHRIWSDARRYNRALKSYDYYVDAGAAQLAECELLSASCAWRALEGAVGTHDACRVVVAEATHHRGEATSTDVLAVAARALRGLGHCVHAEPGTLRVTIGGRQRTADTFEQAVRLLEVVS